MAKKETPEVAQVEQAPARQLQVVEVDGDVYLGVLESGKLTEALSLDHGIACTMSRDAVAEFFCRRNMGELLTINFASSAVPITTRDLNEEETAMFQQCNTMMDRANRLALKRLVNREFSSLLGK